MHPEVVAQVVRDLEARGARVERDPKSGLLRINGMFSVSLVLSRCRQTSSGSFRWELRLDQSLRPDITIAVRIDPSNQSPLDYYILPGIDLEKQRLRLAEDNGALLDTYRFDTLDYFLGMAELTEMEAAA